MTSMVRKLSIPFLVIALTIGCFGNLLIIIFFAWTRGGHNLRRHPYTLFFVHLAVADLFACVLVPVYYLPQDLANGHWPFGEFLCEYTIFIPTGVAMYATCWMLFAIIYERYRSLVHPLKRKMEQKHIHLICFGAWVLSCLLHIPYFMSTSLVPDPKHQNVLKCHSSPSSLFKHSSLNITYFTARLLFQSLIPVTLMVFFYYKIHKAMNGAQRRQNTLGVESTSRTLLHRQKRSIIRAIQIALIIFSVTIILNNVGQLVRAIVIADSQQRWDDSGMLKTIVEFFIRFLGVNNIINCFIYTGSMSNFRRFVFDVLRCRFRRKSFATPSSETQDDDSTTHQTTIFRLKYLPRSSKVFDKEANCTFTEY
eukprot:TCONS_00033693-protein